MLRQELSIADKAERLTFWSETLRDLNQINLHQDFISSGTHPFANDNYSIILEKTLDEQSLLCALFILLHLMTNENDICVGVTTPLNTLPLRLRFTPDQSIEALSAEIANIKKKIFENELPLSNIIQEGLNVKERISLSMGIPFNVSYNFLRDEPRKNPAETSKTLLNFIYQKHSSLNVELCINYNKHYFSGQTIEHLGRRYQKILQQIQNSARQKISAINHLTAKELQLINTFNATHRDQSFVSLHDCLHRIARTFPHKKAIHLHRKDSARDTLNYEKLDKLSTLLANHLRAHGVTNNTPVGVCLPRSTTLFIAFFAVLKAGGVFVPLAAKDAANPHKIANAEIEHILGKRKNRQGLPTKHYYALDERDEWDKILSESEHYSPPFLGSRLEHPAYLVYTSGTSGAQPVPKGVRATHAGLSNLLMDMVNQASLPDAIGDLKILSTAPTTFDAFIYDIVKMLAYAGELHLHTNKERLIPHVIEETIRENNINFTVLLPAIMKELDPNLPLQHIISMGEPAKTAVLQQWFAANPKRRIEIGYGLTETTICTSLHTLKSHHKPNLTGQPISNTQILILHPTNYRLCPINVVGEIYISGVGIAPGYFKSPEKTREKFLWLQWDAPTESFKPALPEAPEATQFFATGDLACYTQTDEGLTVEFLGRTDRKIKIHGAVPVDLEEMENVLRKLPAIKDIVIVATADNNALVAYVVLHSDATSVEELRCEVQKKLEMMAFFPPISFPQYFYKVPLIPRSSNGKTDIRQLKSASLMTSPQEKINYNSMQEKLVALWCEILSTGEYRFPAHLITLGTPFAYLGGNSIKAARLAAVIHKEFKLIEPIDPQIFMPSSMTIYKLENAISQKLQKPIPINSTQNFFMSGKSLIIRPPQREQKNKINSTNNQINSTRLKY